MLQTITEEGDTMYIERIKRSGDIKKIDIDELESLAEEIRFYTLERCSRYGGHLGSNLGIVELTIAIHYVFNIPNDKVVFDVSHQVFTHKILTGRGFAFTDEEKYGEVIEFSSPKESESDLFHMGHTSTSIGLAVGLAKMRDILKKQEKIIAVIGDAALGGGQAYEGLNIAGDLNSQLLVVLNDNEMSVFDNHGSLYNHLKELRKSLGTSSNNLFRDMGFEYHYLEDGNNVKELIEGLESVKYATVPTVLHVHTKKGRGYTFAEQDKAKWHYSKPFDLKTGEVISSLKTSAENYGNITYDLLSSRIKKIIV